MGKERKRVAGIFVALCLALSQGGCAGGYFHDVENASQERVQFGLDSLPFREYWTGITLNGAKIGFTNFSITPSEREKAFTSPQQGRHAHTFPDDGQGCLPEHL